MNVDPAAVHLLSRSHYTNAVCPCHSPTLRPWIMIDTSYVEGCWSRMLTRVSHTLRREPVTHLHTGEVNGFDRRVRSFLS